MISPSQGAGRALARAAATYAQLEHADTLKPLLDDVRATCLAPWLDAGLGRSGESRYTQSASVMGEYAKFDGWEVLDLAHPDGTHVLRMQFWLNLDTGPTGNMEAVLELSATEFIGGAAGRCIDMQVARKSVDVQDGSSCWPQLSAALLKEFVVRREGRRVGVPFPAILQCVAAESLDWLVP